MFSYTTLPKINGGSLRCWMKLGLILASQLWVSVHNQHLGHFYCTSELNLMQDVEWSEFWAGQEIIVAGGWGEKREETTNTTEHYDVYKGTVRYGGCLPLKRTAFQMVAFHSYDVITPQTCHGVCPAVCFDADRGKCMQKTANGYETMEETRRMYWIQNKWTSRLIKQRSF